MINRPAGARRAERGTGGRVFFPVHFRESGKIERPRRPLRLPARAPNFALGGRNLRQSGGASGAAPISARTSGSGAAASAASIGGPLFGAARSFSRPQTNGRRRAVCSSEIDGRRANSAPPSRDPPVLFFLLHERREPFCDGDRRPRSTPWPIDLSIPRGILCILDAWRPGALRENLVQRSNVAALERGAREKGRERARVPYSLIFLSLVSTRMMT